MATTVPARLGNLPVELTSFVGRGSELAAVKRRLADARLVTLTGVGGTGKTRLALRIATSLHRAFRDGVWFVDLAQWPASRPREWENSHPHALAELVLAVLGVRRQGGQAPTEQLTRYLADRPALLVLDNCEHLLPACAMLVHALLATCPALRVLTTSREPLAIAGEALQVVPPLSTPEATPLPNPTDMAGNEAVALFLARAGEVRSSWTLTADNAGAVAALCRRLDGLPLAIELAAARIRILEPGQILDRLTDRFGLLTRGGPGTPTRQQTMRSCIEWSFDLCGKREQLLWRRLSVFAGDFELDAVEGVCADDQALPERDLLDVVAGLVDKSILTRADAGDDRAEASQLRMLETIREFGRERLLEAGEDQWMRGRHRDWYQLLAQRATAQWMSRRQGYWTARLPREHPNLRAAMEYALTEPGGAETALRLIMSVPTRYWFDSGRFSQARRWLDDALARSSAPCAARARALILNSQLATVQGDIEAGSRLLEEGEGLARQLDARVELAYAAHVRALEQLYRGDFAGAVVALERVGTFLSTAPAPDSGLGLELHLGTLNALGVALSADPVRADACFRQLLEITQRLGEYRYRSYALWGMALSAWRRAEVPEAKASLHACLRLVQKSGSMDAYSVAHCLEGSAWVEADRRRYQRAATLLGAADALRARTGTPVTALGHILDYHNACHQESLAALGDTAFTVAFARGQALSPDGAITYALDDQHQPPPAPPVSAPNSLTRREQQVAELIAQGLSNKAVAAALVISPRTVESHVEHILHKLGFANRAQVAAWNAGGHRGS